MGDSRMSEPRLVYVDPKGVAYFQDIDPREATGDDWDDAPWRNSAGPPCHGYGNHPDATLIAFTGDIEVNDHGYSVDAINHGASYWLCGGPWSTDTEYLGAGATIAEFKAFVRRHEGRVFVEEAA